MRELTPHVPQGMWFKSSYSGANTSECVETAILADMVAVRDSKRPDGPALAFSQASWALFITSVGEKKRP
ncbi:MAG: hypothetical protein QOF44_4194 [Streptomyces sp.]|nr:hypothetical protein [Streptomyces sp.]